jgi:3-deoxy-D-manno-octulosonic acid kinase
MEIITQKKGVSLFFSNRSLFLNNETPLILNQYFESDYWFSHQRIIGTSKGRNTTWFIQPYLKQKTPIWVLRHYYRGGFIARFLYDRYCYNGLKKTRVYQEMHLLSQMRALGLPVPQAIAGRVIQKGIFYQADLLMEKIEGKDLISVLKNQSITDDLWKKIGQTIAFFHQKGIDHSDLNARNIIITHSKKNDSLNTDPKLSLKNNGIYLIDFDCCHFRKNRTIWPLKNMERLYRSLKKELLKEPSLSFSERDWAVCLLAYKKV